MHTDPLNLKAPVFNIQPFSIHDGPGIRTTVFLKGCPMGCVWCANPESNLAKPQLMVYPSRCTGCGKCISACPQNAVSVIQGKTHTRREDCRGCGLCAEICPQNARELSGREMTVRQVLDRVLEDRLFLSESGGGMTVSGGECLMYPDFTDALLRAVQENGLTTAVETSCCAPQEVIHRIFSHVDIPLLDIKHMDPQMHKFLTGVDNRRILSNILHIRRELGKQVTIRVPVIPGCNDSEENIRALGVFVALELGEETPVHLLPYHRLGESKRESLGLSPGFSTQPPSDEHMTKLQKILEQYGLTVQIGG